MVKLRFAARRLPQRNVTVASRSEGGAHLSGFVNGMSKLDLLIDDTQALGLVIQAAGALLISFLCVQLNRIAQARALTAWARSWFSLGVALVSLLVEQKVPSTAVVTLPVYLFSEYLFALWLMEGCAVFGEHPWPSARFRRFVGPMGVVAIITPQLTGYEFDHVFILQSAVLSAAFAGALSYLVTSKQHRSSPGMAVMRVALALLAGLFLLYVPIYGAHLLMGTTLPLALLKYSSILHLLVEFQLGFAGASLILEQTNYGLVQRNNSLSSEAAKYRGQAERDALTNAYTRNALLQRLAELLSRAEASGTSVSFLYCDIDNFKRINDSRGHAYGDHLLVLIAKRLEDCIGQHDFVVRMGGDEFLIVVTDAKQQQGSVLPWVTELQRAVSSPATIEGIVADVQVSMGVSTFPADGRDAKTLLQRADIALYQAKSLGRNNCQLFNSAMNEKIQRRSTLAHELQLALGTEQLFLVYQPIVDLECQRIIALEALVRWQHPTEGLISPAEFISVAESSGLIAAIGEFVLRQVCVQINAWQIDFVPLVPIAVNVSSAQLQRGRLADRVIGIVTEADVDPALVRLEITESGLVHNVEENIAALQRLREFGFKISVDDFGTGYSCLSYLKALPIDCLKIDRSFVAEITTDERNAAVVGAVMTMAQSMNLMVIAEGVETADQVSALKLLGCSVAQGYFFHRPMAALECRQLLEGLAKTAPSEAAQPARPRASRSRANIISC